MFLNGVDEDLNSINSSAAEMFHNCQRRRRPKQLFPSPVANDQDGTIIRQLRPKTISAAAAAAADVHHDETYGFAAAAAAVAAPSKTKSVDNLCDQIEEEIMRRNSSTILDGHSPTTAPTTSSKKRITYLSNRIRVMSNRTQRLFHRFVQSGKGGVGSGGDSAAQSEDSNNDFVMLRAADATTALPASLTTCKSRRSLSYGNLPAIDDFNLMNAAADGGGVGNDMHTLTKRLDALGGGSMDGAIELNMADDADSGILVNESGQSSIIETEFKETTTNRMDSDDATAPEVCCGDDLPTMAAPTTMEYKCVRIHLMPDDDDEKKLLVSVAPMARSTDATKRIGYVVTAIHAGGLIAG